ncbi:hypothetical protein [Rhodococcus koreensis]|uniref:hypothetical protein n=1 Tax=Rhodococcus koreensis TaxID=99653 RepID=UPI00366B3AE7
MTTTEDSGRPRWSASEAAKRCGVGRATIQRRLEAGLIPGAERTREGWSIPIEGLLAAGFTPDRHRPPAPPEAAREQDQVTTEQVRAADHLAQRVRELEQQLTAAQAEAVRERTARESAERLAVERDRIIEVQERALRMLEAGQSGRNATPPAAATSPPAPRQRGFLGRIADNFGL